MKNQYWTIFRHYILSWFIISMKVVLKLSSSLLNNLLQKWNRKWSMNKKIKTHSIYGIITFFVSSLLHFSLHFYSKLWSRVRDGLTSQLIVFLVHRFLMYHIRIFVKLALSTACFMCISSVFCGYMSLFYVWLVY